MCSRAKLKIARENSGVVVENYQPVGKLRRLPSRSSGKVIETPDGWRKITYRVAIATYGIFTFLEKESKALDRRLLILGALAAMINLFLLLTLTAAANKTVQHESALWDIVTIGLFSLLGQ